MLYSVRSSFLVSGRERGNPWTKDVSSLAGRSTVPVMHDGSTKIEKGERRLATPRFARNNALAKEASFTVPKDYCNDFVCDSSPQIEQVCDSLDDGDSLSDSSCLSFVSCNKRQYEHT